MVVGIWARVAAVAGSTGPPVGGLLAAADWRWIFLINVPIGAATLLGGWRVLPEMRSPKGTRLPDAGSALVLLAAVTLLVLGAVQAPAWGWADPRTLGLLAAALLAIALTVHRTLRRPHALIEKSLFGSRPFTFAASALLLFFIGFATFLLASVLFLQDQWHYSALRAGLAIAPGPVTAAVLALNAGRIAARLRRPWPAVLGASLMTASAAFWMIAATPRSAYLTAFLPGLIVAGMSAGLTQAPLFAAAGSLPPDRATTGSAVLNAARQVGSAIGVAVTVVMLGTAARPSLAGFRLAWAAEAAAGALAALAAAASARQRRRVAKPRFTPG